MQRFAVENFSFLFFHQSAWAIRQQLRWHHYPSVQDLQQQLTIWPIGPTPV